MHTERERERERESYIYMCIYCGMNALKNKTSGW